MFKERRTLGEVMSDEVRNAIIIGSGPAGYTAGLYSARAMLEPLMFAGYASGGQLMLTSDVENFPGYPQGIGGPDMMIQMREQAERFGLEVQDKNVERVDVSERPFKVWVEGEEFRAQTLIICTGAEAIWLGVEGEDAQKGRGISTCATCDGAFSAMRRLSLSAVAIQRWKKQHSSRGLQARLPSSIDVMFFAHRK